MPTWDRLTAEWPTCRLEASGEAVGPARRPDGQLGGRPPQPGCRLPACSRTCRGSARAIADGTFFSEPGAARGGSPRARARDAAAPDGPDRAGWRARRRRAHRWPWSSWRARERPAGGSRAAARLHRRARHARRARPGDFLPWSLRRIAGRATVATVTGRFYAMDRDRTLGPDGAAWEAIVHGAGESRRDAAEASTSAACRAARATSSSRRPSSTATTGWATATRSST